jgi:hypothetical protein
MSAEPSVAMGLAWYSPQAWRQLAAIPEAHIEKSYDDFVRTFESMAREFAVHGIVVEKIIIDVDHMVAWLRRHGYDIDNPGRAKYGAMLMVAGGDPKVLDKTPIVDNTRVLQ